MVWCVPNSWVSNLSAYVVSAVATDPCVTILGKDGSTNNFG
jgi:hypothetical protein